MRRIACTLAILGISLQPVMANDPFAQPAFQSVTDHSQTQQQQTGRSLQFFSASGTESKKATAEKIPQKFTRTQEADARSQKQPGDELKNYYAELFGNQPSKENLNEVASERSRLEPSSEMRTVESHPATPQPESGVIQAEYKSQQHLNKEFVQQVSDSDDARPFPGAVPQTAAMPTSSPFAEPPADQSRSSLMNAQGGFGEFRSQAQAQTQPQAKIRTSLTNPIQMDHKPATPITTASSTKLTGGNVSYTSAPSAAMSKPAMEYTRSTPITAADAHGEQSPNVTIEWVKTSNINVGQECLCDLVVKNTGQSPADNVVVEARFPKNVRLIKSSPTPDTTTTILGWNFDKLDPGEKKVIQITMIPLQRGNIETHADVRFSANASGVFNVAEPLLAVKLEGPGEVLVGEPAPVTVTVSNPGTGIAQNVVIEALVPEGLEHTRGERLLMELGSLNPSESRSVRLALSAARGGRHVVQVQTRGSSDLVQNSSTEVSVISASLVTKIDGPGLRYLGRQGKFILQVGNDGEAASNNVRVMYKIPEGFRFVSADRGAEFDSTTGLLNWFVGRLEQRQQAQMTVTLEATSSGQQKHLVRATTEHGSMQDAELITAIEGTSSLSIEVVDLDDPVETGSEAIYEIRVKNEGSAAARNVGVACELAPGMQYISAEGPSAHIAENGQVVFRSIPELGPEKTTTFRVHVSSQSTGHARFRARLSSESVAEPLTAEELTKFYGE